MRRAELVMALALGVLSAYLMVKSAELPIGWIPREGPGGGAFPFWLSAGMLVCFYRAALGFTAKPGVAVCRVVLQSCGTWHGHDSDYRADADDRLDPYHWYLFCDTAFSAVLRAGYRSP